MTATNSNQSDLMEIRSLVASNQVGGIIGKSGSNIAKVREQSGAFISILKNETFSTQNSHINPRNINERIMIFKGTCEQIAAASKVIAQLIIDTSNERITAKNASDSTTANVEKLEKTAVKLLVHRSQVGCILGKQGALIKEMQELSQTRIQVSNDVLTNSTEKSVNIMGTPQQIQKAMSLIVKCLYDNPLPINTKNYMYVPGTGHSTYGRNDRSNDRNSKQRNASQSSQSNAPNAQNANTSDVPQSTQKIAIPSVCAGTVIGRHGAVIRDLRAQSGTSISIADAESDNSEERIVTLTGSAEGIQTAVYLIRQLVEQYKPQE